MIVELTQVNDERTQLIVEEYDFNTVGIFDIEAGFWLIVEVAAANDWLTNFND